MRTRSWRRSKSTSILRRRLIDVVARRSYRRYRSQNGDQISNPHWTDLIGGDTFKMYKGSVVTHAYDSRWKIKYSPNKSIMRNEKIKHIGISTGKREGDKILLRMLIDEET